MGRDPWICAFAPITLLSAGGFLAVSYLKNRESTSDLDYFLEPQWADDEDIKKPLRNAVSSTGKALDFVDGWANDDMAFFISYRSRQLLFEEAKKQNIVLWEGLNLRILAVPLEWALERKLRRIHNGMQDHKRDSDTSDALALLKTLRVRNGGPLVREYIRTLNMCSTEMLPDSATMDEIAAAYRSMYNEEAFT
ncbi:hypothetical protein I7I53_07196 [Histoplasma capsulatum var. duboisii H88]|uniref:Uncharacterized protein n=1 Tax=Ajellomyces capsulatus (strain H88) TaxID=544711 RepID=A0A8A1LGL6_AJEC8|nr:hypothetical protein I7I53_07196 [Histoplasma capsulatum var. duboisii H88]